MLVRGLSTAPPFTWSVYTIPDALCLMLFSALAAFGVASVLWKAIGDALDVQYDCLPSSRQGWKDGLSWLEVVQK